jgi:hypothetical protein
MGEENKQTPYSLAVKQMEETRKGLSSQIREIGSEMASIIEQDKQAGSRYAMIARRLRDYPDCYNPPELKELAEANDRFGKLYAQKLEAEKELRSIQQKMRAF